MNEIENLVQARIGPRDDAGKGHGRLRRRRGGEATERSPLPQALQIRQPSAIHQRLHDTRVHAVEGDHQYATGGRRGPAPGTRRQDRRARRSSHHSDEVASEHNRLCPSI